LIFPWVRLVMNEGPTTSILSCLRFLPFDLQVARIPDFDRLNRFFPRTTPHTHDPGCPSDSFHAVFLPSTRVPSFFKRNVSPLFLRSPQGPWRSSAVSSPFLGVVTPFYFCLFPVRAHVCKAVRFCLCRCESAVLLPVNGRAFSLHLEPPTFLKQGGCSALFAPLSPPLRLCPLGFFHSRTPPIFCVVSCFCGACFLISERVFLFFLFRFGVFFSFGGVFCRCLIVDILVRVVWDVFRLGAEAL